MKGLDRHLCATAFIAEGLSMIYDTDDYLSAVLTQWSCRYIADILIARRIEMARRDGVNEQEIADLRGTVVDGMNSRGPLLPLPM
jgi:hypothetical protein